jgi:hypothetical protein
MYCASMPAESAGGGTSRRCCGGATPTPRPAGLRPPEPPFRWSPFVARVGRCFAAQLWSPFVVRLGRCFAAQLWSPFVVRLGRCFAAQLWSPSVLTVGALLRSPPVVTFGAHLGWSRLVPLFWPCFVAGSSVSCFLWAPVCRACHLGVVVEGRIVSWFGLFGGGFRHCRREPEGAGCLGHYLWGHGQLAGPPAGFGG